MGVFLPLSSTWIAWLILALATISFLKLCILLGLVGFSLLVFLPPNKHHLSKSQRFHSTLAELTSLPLLQNIRHAPIRTGFASVSAWTTLSSHTHMGLALPHSSLCWNICLSLTPLLTKRTSSPKNSLFFTYGFIFFQSSYNIQHTAQFYLLCIVFLTLENKIHNSRDFCFLHFCALRNKNSASHIVGTQKFICPVTEKNKWMNELWLMLLVNITWDNFQPCKYLKAQINRVPYFSINKFIQSLNIIPKQNECIVNYMHILVKLM